MKTKIKVLLKFLAIFNTYVYSTFSKIKILIPEGNLNKLLEKLRNGSYLTKRLECHPGHFEPFHRGNKLGVFQIKI